MQTAQKENTSGQGITRQRLLSELAESYEGIKFRSQLRNGLLSLSWANGPSNREVWAKVDTYIDCSGQDGSLFKDISLTRYRKDFYFPEIIEQLKAAILNEGIPLKHPDQARHLANRLFVEMFNRQSFPADAEVTGLEETQQDRISTRYRFATARKQFQIV